MNSPHRALWIKVCGLRTIAAVQAAAEAGADAVGFVFHAQSPRCLEPETARELARSVPDGVAKVAVFLHPSQALLDAACAAVQPDYVQADVGDLVHLRVSQDVRVLPVYRSGQVADMDLPRSRRFLFESGRSGSGELADWIEAARLARLAELVLAGGLTTQNVARAIEYVRPFGVDVSSGVERSRGVKDEGLIRDFVRAARAAEAALARAQRQGEASR